MISAKKRIIAVLVALCMVSTLSLTACGVGEQVQQATDDAIEAVAQMIDGEVTGEIGTEYTTKWFTFTVDSMSTSYSYGDYTAEAGNILVIAHITEKNISGATQPFGTFDWFVDDTTLADYIYPLEPMNDDMMPESFELSDGETASYDVVIEFPEDLANPFLMYIEADDQGSTYDTFMIPIKK